MRLIALFITLIFSQVSFAQTDPTKYAEIISESSLQKHLTIIAGPEMEGRGTATEGERKAAEYIISQLKSFGLSSFTSLNGYRQLFPLNKDINTKDEFKADGKKAKYGVDYIFPLKTNSSLKTKTKEIVFAGYGIEDEKYNDYSKIDVKGKTVIIFLGEPKDQNNFVISGTSKGSMWTSSGLTSKLKLAKEKGALNVLFISIQQDTISKASAKNNLITDIYYPTLNKEEYISHAIISHAFAKNILANKADAIFLKATKQISFNQSDYFSRKLKIKTTFKKKTETVNSANVIGFIEGSDKKDEYVFLTAHYDHLGIRNGLIYYGADDDGSGTAAIMLMGEAFAKAKAEGNGPRRTIVIMAVSGEERGLWGSEYYSDNPVVSLDKTTANINTDMIGRVDTERMKDDTLNYIYAVGHNKLSSDLKTILEATNSKYSNLILDYKFDDPADVNRIYYRSDHFNFARKGVPALFFYDGMLKADYHKPTDTVDKINWTLYKKRAQLIFYTAWEIANRDNILVRDIPLTY
ncbi:MAG: M28 family peptidase [Ferruginibacter sp.]